MKSNLIQRIAVVARNILSTGPMLKSSSNAHAVWFHEAAGDGVFVKAVWRHAVTNDKWTGNLDLHEAVPSYAWLVL